MTILMAYGAADVNAIVQPPACVLCGAKDSSRILDRVRCEDLERLFTALAGDAVRPEFRQPPAAELELVHCVRCDLRFFSPSFVGGDHLYSVLQRFPWYYMEEKAEFALAAPFVAPGARVLEVGAGRGSFLRHVDAGSYVGLELNPVAVAEGRDRGTDLRVELLGQHAPGHPNAYDVVVAFQLLEHIAAPGEFLADAMSVLRPGGRLIVSVPAEDSYLGSAQNYTLNLPPHHQSRWTRAAAESVSRIFGLRILELHRERLGDAHLADFAEVRIDAALTLGRRRVVDLSPAASVRHLAARALSRLAVPVMRRIPRPMGHSMTVVFERST